MITSESMMSTWRSGVLEDLERLLAGGGLDHGVAAQPQRAGGEGAHRVLVLDQQHEAAAGEVARRASARARAAAAVSTLS